MQGLLKWGLGRNGSVVNLVKKWHLTACFLLSGKFDLKMPEASVYLQKKKKVQKDFIKKFFIYHIAFWIKCVKQIYIIINLAKFLLKYETKNFTAVVKHMFRAFFFMYHLICVQKTFFWYIYIIPTPVFEISSR